MEVEGLNLFDFSVVTIPKEKERLSIPCPVLE